MAEEDHRGVAFASSEELARRIRTEDDTLTSEKLVELYFGRIEKHNDKLHAVVHWDEERTLREAREADRVVKASWEDPGIVLGPLHGVPVTIKDSWATGGMLTTSNSSMCKDYVPEHDAPCVALLRRAGAIVLGKSNLPEFAGDAQVIGSVYPRGNNPFALDRTPGGSSGGGAAAVAAGLCALDLGSSIGGSVEIPAAYCGLFGMKFGDARADRQGHVPPPPDGSTPGQAVVEHMPSPGVETRYVEDLVLAARALLQPPACHWTLVDTSVAPVYWNEDAYTAAEATPSFRVAVDSTVGGVVEVTTQRLLEGLAEAMKADGSFDVLPTPDVLSKAAGASNEGTVLPAWGTLFGAQLQMTAPSSFVAMAMRWGTWTNGLAPFNSPVKRSMSDGGFYTLQQFGMALNQRRCVQRHWRRYFDEHKLDAIVLPVAIGGVAFKHNPGQKDLPVRVADGRTVMVHHFEYSITCTAPLNYAGIPTVVCPLGRSEDGLPVGVMIAALPFQEEKLLAIAQRLTSVGKLAFIPPPGY